jgi:hypothetical protein
MTMQNRRFDFNGGDILRTNSDPLVLRGSLSNLVVALPSPYFSPRLFKHLNRAPKNPEARMKPTALSPSAM